MGGLHQEWLLGFSYDLPIDHVYLQEKFDSEENFSKYLEIMRASGLTSVNPISMFSEYCFVHKKNPDSILQKLKIRLSTQSDFMVSVEKEIVIKKLTTQDYRKESELINGFEAYKLTIERDGTTNEIWFSKTLREPDFVIKIKNEISEFQNSWADMSIDLTEYGIDKDSIIVKMSTESEDGNFNFDLISFQKFLGNDEELKVPEDYKKVRKI